MTTTPRNKIRIESEQVSHNPHMQDSGLAMGPGSVHYKVVLRFQHRQMTLFFSHGSAICADPTADSVLDCLISDLCGTDDEFEDWASNNGYDPDSRSAEKTYRTVKAQAAKTKRLLGDALDDYYNAEDQEAFLKNLCRR